MSFPRIFGRRASSEPTPTSEPAPTSETAAPTSAIPVDGAPTPGFPVDGAGAKAAGPGPAGPREIRFADVSIGVLDDTADGEVTRAILSDVSFTLTEERVVYLGANGSGKSTLLQLFNGLVTANSGRVLVDGMNPVAAPAQVRSRVGFVFTDPAAQLVMPTPVEDIELSLRKRVPKAERRAAALTVLEELGIADLADRSVYELSGGQRQLVALAAVLAVDPQILVLDEPTTLLDLRNREKLRTLLGEVVTRRGVRVIFSTHDLEFATLADRALVVDGGRIVHDSAPTEAVEAYRALIMSEST